MAMFTNEKLLGVILIIFVVAASVYFAFIQFKQEVNDASVSPSPSPSGMAFLFNATPPPGQAQTANQSAELPLERNKRLAQFPGLLKPEILQNKKAVIQTARGNIALQIYPEATMAASNFLILASNGFYNGLVFHRVEPGFVIQGGDPLGNGSGGPGYLFPDEPVAREYKKGTVAMANAGPNTNGSQFFIVLTDNPPLQPLYTIFGQVISGMDVVEKIAVGDVMQKVTVQNLQ